MTLQLPPSMASPLSRRSAREGFSAHELIQRFARTRRDFLRSAAGLALGSTLLGPRAFAAATAKKRKVVVITFGGGARDQETFAPEGQENIPHLMSELIPQSTFFTQVVNRGILGHYVATASLATGVYETINNFASLPPEHPTVFEYFRKDLKRPSADAWVVAPSNGFNRIGESSHRSYGPGLGARVILPKHLLTAAISRGRNDYEHLLRDNYETPLYAPELGGGEFELQQTGAILKLSVDDFKAHARTLSSPDELSVYIADSLMRQVAPSLLWITMHDIDVAHAGAYSLYIDGIRRTDRLCAGHLEGHPERAGIRRKHHDVHPAGFRPRFRRRLRRQRIPASPHRRRTLPHHVDDGSGRGSPPGSRLRPCYGVHRSCPDNRLHARLLALTRARQADSGTLVTMLPTDLKPELFDRYPAGSEKPRPQLHRLLAALAADFCAQSCCARSSTTISNFPPSARP